MGVKQAFFGVPRLPYPRGGGGGGCVVFSKWWAPAGTWGGGRGGGQQWVGGFEGKGKFFPLYFHELTPPPPEALCQPPPPVGVGQVLWVPAKSGCLPFSFSPPALLKKSLGGKVEKWEC